MKKSFAFSFLLCIVIGSVNAESIPMGGGLAHAINETMVDKKAYNHLTNILDVFLDKVKFTPGQWQQMYEFLIEGRGLLDEKLSPELTELQIAFQQEQSDLLEAIFDPEAGELDFASAQTLLQEAFAELQSDEKFEKMFEHSKKEHEFKAKVANCLLSDISENFSDAEQQAEIQKQQLNMIMRFLDYAIATLQHKLANS